MNGRMDGGSPGVAVMNRQQPASPKHYLVLDGLRGIAAFSVVAMHIGAWFDAAGICRHAYLAVDFFFLLSGFVIAHAYEGRLLGGRIGVVRFILLRLARLYPMIFLGVVIGGAYLILRFSGGHRDFSPAWISAAIIGSACLAPLIMGSPGAEVFPLNGPLWSLFFELAANIFYAMALRRLRLAVLAVLVALSALGLLACAIENNRLDLGDHVAGFSWGFARVGFSFFAGVLIYRLKPQERWHGPRFPPLAAALLLFGLFCVPRSISWCGAYDAVCVIVVFPVLMVACVNAKAKGLTAWLCALSGELSYPVYVLQKPVTLWLTSAYLSFHVLTWPKPAPGVLATVGIALTCLVALKLWDEPVRALLARALKVRTAITPLADSPS